MVCGGRLGRSTLASWLTATLLAAAPAAAQAPDIELHGFAEFGAGARVRDDPRQPDDILLSEARFRLELAHFTDVFTRGHADAALAASIFHFADTGVSDLKRYLQTEGIPVRL